MKKIGFIGLGKMGFNMVKRLLKFGHQVVVFDRSELVVKQLEEIGAIGANSIKNLLDQLPERKIIWLMVPAGNAVDESLDSLLKYMKEEDIVIDGGNSFWRESQERAAKSATKGVYFIDCGTSGGIWGLENGYCLMAGGDQKAINVMMPVFKALSPEGGFVHCGISGTGHLVKMIHNGIEYGMMQAYAEGFEILEKAPFDLNLSEIADAWQYGSVVRSWLLELAVSALQQDPHLDQLEDYVSDSGEGRWTLQTAMDFDVPVHVIAASLFNRFSSRQDESFAMKMLAALRNQFGGHAVKTKKDQ